MLVKKITALDAIFVNLRRAKGYRNIMLASGCRRIIKYYTG